VKTTIEIPDDLLRLAKATAAREGKPLSSVITRALRDHLGRRQRAVPGNESWRKVFGKVKPEDVHAVEVAVSDDLERIEAESWR
jgi:hypothetical protein